MRVTALATLACRRSSTLLHRAAPRLFSSSAAPHSNQEPSSSSSSAPPSAAVAPPLPTLHPRPAPARHHSATPPSPAPDPRAAIARHGKQRDDQAGQRHPPQEDVSLPPNPLAVSPGGPFAARPDRDPWPAPMPCLSREAGAGHADESYSTMSGAVAGTHTPGAHHLEADGTDVEDDDHVSPPPEEPLEMSRDDAQKAYPLDRDPSVGGGMATRARPKGTQLPPDP